MQKTDQKDRSGTQRSCALDEDSRPASKSHRAAWRGTVGAFRGAHLATLAGALLVVYLVTVGSILFRPDGTEWSVWTPASGIAVAVTVGFAHRHLWKVATFFGIAVGAASFTARGDATLAVGGLIAVALGVWLGALALLGMHGPVTSRSAVSGLARLFSCAFVTSVTIGLAGGVFVVAARGPDAFTAAFTATVLSHAIGVLFVIPLVLGSRGPRGAASRTETAFAWLVLSGVIAVTFGMNEGLPLASIVIVPLTWASARLAPRSSFSMLFLTAAAVAFFSPLGRGPFGSTGLDSRTSASMVQIFDLSIGVAFITLVTVAVHQRRLAEALRGSEILFRTAFESSLMGTAIVHKTFRGPVMEQLNPSGRAIAGAVDDRMPLLRNALTRDGFQRMIEVIGRYDEAGADEWRGTVSITTGQVLEVLLSRLTSDLDGNTYAIQFLDVTDRVRAQDIAREELVRAGEVQRALLPKDTDPLPGFDVAGGCTPAATVGGDFYDWYPVSGGMAFSLGDVMGKGVGAGMIATTIRAVLRSSRHEPHVSRAVARASNTLDTQVAEANSFATLFHGRISAEDGTFSFVDAGHGLVLILRADGTAEMIGSIDVPLGVVPGSVWTERNETLHYGDMLIAVSDGVLELYDGTLDAMDIVADLARRSSSASDLAATITALAVGTDAPDDDVTVLAIRRMPAA